MVLTEVKVVPLRKSSDLDQLGDDSHLYRW